MRRSPSTIPPTIFETFPRSALLRATTARPLTLTTHRPLHTTTPKMSSSLFQQYRLTTPASTLPSQPSLSPAQQLLTCSVLDLFAGHPSKRKLTLWTDDASFHDPLTNAEGRTQFEAQWYGLRAAFSEIERLGVDVKSGGNPVELGLKTRYKVKGVGSEQTIDSQILIHTVGEGDAMRIKKVEDKWDGEIKEGPIKKALRELNSKTVPLAVSVPKSVEEEEAGQK